MRRTRCARLLPVHYDPDPALLHSNAMLCCGLTHRGLARVDKCFRPHTALLDQLARLDAVLTRERLIVGTAARVCPRPHYNRALRCRPCAGLRHL